MTLRYMLKMRTVRLLQWTEAWDEPSLMSSLVYNRVDTEAGIEMLSVNPLFHFHLKFITRKPFTCPVWFVTWSICYQIAQISCHYWISPSSLCFIAPIATLCFHMVFPGELDVARVNTGDRCCSMNLLVNISINVSVRTPYVEQECVLASRK